MIEFKNWLRKILGQYSCLAVEVYYFWRYHLLYRGDNHFCPCCSSKLRIFLPLRKRSGALIPSVICPRCDAHPRHRLLWQYLRKKQQELFSTEKKILHIAPEFCFARRFRKMNNVFYVTADIEMSCVDFRVDVCRLPFLTNCFDVVLCNHVLEHIPADMVAMSELFRVLRPGGWALLQVPLDKNRNQSIESADISSPEDRERVYGQFDHVRLYGLDFLDRLVAAGFAVETINFADLMSNEDVFLFGIDPDESVYLCQKL